MNRVERFYADRPEFVRVYNEVRQVLSQISVKDAEEMLVILKGDIDFKTSRLKGENLFKEL